MKFMLKHLKKYKGYVILGPIFKLLEAVLELFIPILTAMIIDHGVRNSDISYVWKIGLVLVGTSVFGLVFAIMCQYMASVASQGFGTSLRSEMFRHINRLSQKNIDNFGSSSLVTRITNDVNQLQTAVAMGIRLISRAPIIAVGAFVMAFIIDWKLSMIFLATIPLTAITVYLIMTKSVKIYRKIQKKLDKTSMIVTENLTGIRVIRAFSNQKSEKTRFNENADELTFHAVLAGKISALMSPITYLIINGATVFIIYLGGYQVFEGRLLQGEIIALVNYLTMVLQALLIIANLVIIYTKASASLERVVEVLEMPLDITENIDNNATSDSFAVRFDNVNFKYSNSEAYVLENLNFTINKGETVGIIGGTGSGKTTIVNLILRFFDTNEGVVSVLGKEVKKQSLSGLRGRIGLVPQKAVLFKGSIRENMLWGNENATDEEIIEAIKLAQGHEFVSALEKGLDYEIEQGGRNLSGGQRQRLTIARAIVRKPEILILDDSASALDYTTDAKLRQALAKIEDEITVIVISQRANSIKHADKILVMDDGVCVAVGTHEQLLESSEAYYEICSSQFSDNELRKGTR